VAGLRQSPAGITDLRPTIEWLLERIDQLESIAEVFPGGVAMFDKHLNMVICNTRLRVMLEYPDALFAQGDPNIEDLFRFNAERGEYGPGEVEALVRQRVDLVRRRVPHVYERKRPNGTIVEVRGVPLNGGGFLTTYFDVTEQRRRAHEFAVLIENFPGGIAMFDEHLNMIVCNGRLKEMLQYPDALFGAGNPNIADLFRFNAERGEYGPGDVEEQVRTRMALVDQHRAHEYERMRPNGTVVEVRGIPLASGGFVTTYTDVTNKRRAQARIAHLAHHDALTGLPNRLLLLDRLNQALATMRRNGGGLALHYLDLDRFKPVNDACGHAVGDGLLKAVGERLREHIRDTDTAARVGGDEFVIMQTRLQDRGDAVALAKRLVMAIGQTFTVASHDLHVGVSIGIALAPEHGADADQLFRQSDLALYRAKSSGRGRFALAA
jgi:diguanylate cyclase (GGDEF)-like protein